MWVNLGDQITLIEDKKENFKKGILKNFKENSSRVRNFGEK